MAKSKKATESSLDLARKAIIKKYGEGVISPLGDHEDLESCSFFHSLLL
jgi:hypothetical protein